MFFMCDTRQVPPPASQIQSCDAANTVQGYKGAKETLPMHTAPRPLHPYTFCSVVGCGQRTLHSSLVLGLRLLWESPFLWLHSADVHQRALLMSYGARDWRSRRGFT